MTPRRTLTDSPFDTLEKTFDLLVTGPDPLALDGTPIAGLPDRAVPLGELKARLLHPSTPFSVRDAIVGELVARSQADGGAWTVGLAGVLLPGLRRAVWPLVQACPGKARRHRGRDPRRLLGRRRRLPARPGPPGVAAVLAGPHRRHSGCCAPSWPSRPGWAPTRSRPPRPGRGATPTWCWPKRCRAGVIGAADAELIGATRIGDVDLADAANAARASATGPATSVACGPNRSSVEWFTGRTISAVRVCRKRAETPCSSSGGRPRHGPVNGPATGQASLDTTTEEVRVPNPARPDPTGATPAPRPGRSTRDRTEEAATTHRHPTNPTQRHRPDHAAAAWRRRLARTGLPEPLVRPAWRIAALSWCSSA